MSWLSCTFGKPAPPERRFVADRARLFHLDRTAELVELLAVPAAARDREWRLQFHIAAWYASTAQPSPQPFTGPDGFPYLRFDLPHPGVFESQSLGNLAAALVERGVGAALFPSPGASPDGAAYVWSMGAFDALLRFDDPDGDPADRESPPTQGPTDPAGHRGWIGAPSADYLPPSSARPLHRHLTERWGMAEPGITLLLDPALSPTRTLIVGRKRSAFPPDVRVDDLVRRLMWFLPPGRVVALLPEAWAADQLVPLSRYC